ncbi:peptide/nickel transport system permease protein [Mumia flava]|uniref:Peptide/nickel transport system permease protein n=1 Tax=Mumia flava TaxID=1348852 RepID=A0A0B2BTP7_9ACTN|nr:ABC transporter permease [Mumia flava]PJJ57090.1 peptide/nickel transport system permease protein [Mumia flava]
MSHALARRLPALRGVRRRTGRPDLLLIAAAVVITATLLVAVAAPLIAPYGPYEVDPTAVFASPSPQHWLGTDDLGRDIFSRILYGARLTLAGPALVTVLVGLIGTVLAIASAWFGGAVDNVITRALDVVLAFPGLILAIIAAAVLGTGFAVPVLFISIAYVPVFARVVRSAAQREMGMPYVAALRISGASPWTICVRHVVPNLLPLIVVQSTVGFGYALLDLAAISFLGLGLQPPTAEWGLMIANGKSAILSGFPQQSLFAAIAVVVVVVAVNILGERLAERFGIEEQA